MHTHDFRGRRRRLLKLENLESRWLLDAGELDLTFGTNGVVISSDIGSAEASSIQGMILQPDGKILVDGFRTTTTDDLVVLRYNADGSPDLSFDGDGKVVGDYASNLADSRPFAIGLQDDGKVLVSGRSPFAITLMRLNADGSRDTSFSGDGTTTPISLDNAGSRTVAVQDDGTVIVAGFHSILRFTSVGNMLDLTRPTYNVFNAVKQSDGKILYSGYLTDGETGGFILARYNANGKPDTTFSGDGIVVTNTLNLAAGKGIAIQSDGKIVMVGTSLAGSERNFAIVRYNPDGSLDSSFSDDGIATLNLSNGDDDDARSVAIQDNGQIVVAGISGTPARTTIVRYNADGSLDTSFGAAGIVKLDFGSGNANENCFNVAVQAGNKIVVQSHLPNSTQLALARLIASDSLISDILDVSPDPRATGVEAVDVVFSEPIDPATFTAADVTLTRNGGSNLINAGVTITALDGDTYRIGGLAGLTAASGDLRIAKSSVRESTRQRESQVPEVALNHLRLMLRCRALSTLLMFRPIIAPGEKRRFRQSM